MNPPVTLNDIITALPEISAQHARSSQIYALLEKVTGAAVHGSRFTQANGGREALGVFGDVEFPYYKMGAVDTLDLFGLDELLIFAFYAVNRGRYRTAADIGANLGLHSILMSRCGWTVKAYEPDPKHAALLRRNVELNRASAVELVEAAVSDAPGTMEFVRVVGNTTSSHLAGAKPGAYGELVRFPVRVESIANIMPAADFVKMDAEGQERIIILGTDSGHWDGTDMMVEVGSAENAEAIYSHLSRIGVSAFAQKLGWRQVERVSDMPASYKDGSVFLSKLPAMPWA